MTAKHGLRAAVREIKGTLTKLIIFDAVINAILVFLFALLVFSLFSAPLVFPLAVSLVYLAYSLRNGLRLNKVRMVEERYENMDEKLRTAAEYEDERNKVVKELHSEVLHDLRKVEEAAFLNEKRIYVKSVAIVALSFLILLLSPVTFGLLNVNLNIADSPPAEADDSVLWGESGDSRIRFAVGEEDAGTRRLNEDIYGTPTVAKLGDEEVRIKIRPAGTELSIREIQEADLPEFSESYPREVSAVAAESFEESIPKEDLELVKGYFNQLAGK